MHTAVHSWAMYSHLLYQVVTSRFALIYPMWPQSNLEPVHQGEPHFPTWNSSTRIWRYVWCSSCSNSGLSRSSPIVPSSWESKSTALFTRRYACRHIERNMSVRQCNSSYVQHAKVAQCTACCFRTHSFSSSTKLLLGTTLFCCISEAASLPLH
jgi:hypothetical protein